MCAKEQITSIPSLNKKLETLPGNPGIYQFKNRDGVILYIGKAINLRRRVRQYFQSKNNASARINSMVAKISDIELIITDSEVEALILEATLIKRHKPHYNIDLKDDKSYPYITITKEPFPRVFVTRRIIKNGSQYFGPYIDVKAMRESLKLVREIFRVRSCNYYIDEEAVRKKKYKLCLDFHIKRCDGPCEGLIDNVKYNEMITEISLLLKGRTDKLIIELEAKMHAAAEALNFEDAKRFRDGITQLKIYKDKQKIIDSELIDRDILAVVKSDDHACGIVFNIRDGKIIGKRHTIIYKVRERSEEEILERFIMNYYLDETEIPVEIYLSHGPQSKEAIQTWLLQKGGKNTKLYIPLADEKVRLMKMCKLNAQIILDEFSIQNNKRKEKTPSSLSLLQKHLRLSVLPGRIECFDVSNIHGKDSVASMVVFINGKPQKSLYRRFKIETVEGPDDYASIREVIYRRYIKVINDNLEKPDLIIVDGGRGQLSSAVSIINSLKMQSENEFNIATIGLAKRLEEVYIPGSGSPLSIPKYSPALRLLQKIRDEAHRFAITYHRKLRSKRTLTTELESIEGVGKVKAMLLLEIFGSVQGIKFATIEQLTDTVGNKCAKNLREYFDKSM
ncbi:MAG: excinuclease ABC subunit C [Ignavibacteriales bacterium]|nr:excinuclease ABC subunit C [Ignavibacteriales bacterium]